MPKFRFTVERTRTGYSAYTEHGNYFVATVAGNMKRLQANMLEALNLSFEEQGKVYTADHIRVVIDLPQFFEFCGVNVDSFGERIGMKQELLMKYFSGEKTPSKAQVNRILTGLQRLGKELSKIEIIR